MKLLINDKEAVGMMDGIEQPVVQYFRKTFNQLNPGGVTIDVTNGQIWKTCGDNSMFVLMNPPETPTVKSLSPVVKAAAHIAVAFPNTPVLVTVKESDVAPVIEAYEQWLKGDRTNPFPARLRFKIVSK